MTMPKSKLASRSSARKSGELQPFIVETVKRSAIQPDERNHRQLDEYSRKRLHADLDRYGLVEPIVANKRTGKVIGGHQRLEWMDVRHKGEDYELQVAWVDLDDADAARLMIVLNNRAAMGEWEPLRLERLISDLKIDPIEEVMFAPLDVEALMPGLGAFGSPPQSAEDDAAKIQEVKGVSAEYRKQSKEKKHGEADSETYIVVCFDSRQEKNAFLARLGLPCDERYVDVGRLVDLMTRNAHEDTSAT